ncbi:alpha/beta hydrolase [Sporosarcina sp. P29]|uniref:alpha/beta hydrolase n=1 Tax=Sporosarcina sp. P29 TaxID=2048252 RepID=UPI001E288585|nr:alpha/beta hydrolase [Sporosarcina sp. P29]
MEGNNENQLAIKRYYYGDLDYQFGDLRIPNSEGPHPVAVVIHGGYWKSDVALDTIADLAKSLTKHGIATWSIEYRRVGQAGGGWPGTLTDAALAIDYLAELAKNVNLDLSRVVTIGHSAGGHLALWLAGRHRLPEKSAINTSNSPFAVQGAISLAGVADLSLMEDVLSAGEKILKNKFNPVRDLLGGTPLEVPERYEQASPIRLLPLGVPQVLIHGALDNIIPIGISQGYKKWLIV